MGYQQQPCDQFPCAQQQQQQQQQQQPFLPPWYRTGGVQQPLAQQAGPSGSGQHNSSARPPQPQSIYGAPYGSYHGSWGGKSNSSFSNAPADGQGWRSRNPSSYQRPSAPGRGNGSSYGSSYNSGYSSPGRGYGSSYGGPDRGYGGGKGRGRGSPSPQRAPSPPVWLKDDCWLVPKPGTVEAAAHAAAVARHRQQQQQQPPNTAVAAGVVAATAHSVAVVASAADVDVVDLTGEDHSSRAGSQAAAAAAAATAAGPLSPSKAEVIDLTGESSYHSPTTVVSQQLSGLQLLLQQHRQQSPQQLVQPHRQQPLPLPPPPQQQQQAAPAREVYIMRGLPGSGKSTRAAQIAAEARAAAGASSNSSVEPVAVHSTDSYFIDPVSGVYVFNAEMLSVNHQKNLDAFCASLAAGVGTVIVDNTNIQPWQYEKYVRQAWAAGYSVREEVVGEFTPSAVQLYAERNTHGVPLDKLYMMLEQWEQQ